MAPESGFIRAIVRPATSLAADHIYQLELSDSSVVEVKMYKPAWLPPTKESEIRFTFCTVVENVSNLKPDMTFTLLQGEQVCGEGTIVELGSSSIAEAT